MDDLKQAYAKAEGADTKFRQAAEERKAMQQVVEGLQKDPFEMLKKIGFNVDELSEKHIIKRLELEAMPKEKREAYEAQQQLAKLQEEKKTWQQQRQQQQISEAQARIEAAISAELSVNKELSLIHI